MWQRKNNNNIITQYTFTFNPWVVYQSINLGILLNYVGTYVPMIGYVLRSI